MTVVRALYFLNLGIIMALLIPLGVTVRSPWYWLWLAVVIASSYLWDYAERKQP